MRLSILRLSILRAGCFSFFAKEILQNRGAFVLQNAERNVAAVIQSRHL